MGKHDIKAETNVLEKMTPEEEKAWYKARIRHLEDEIERIKENLREAEQSVAIMTQLYENSAESLQRSEARSDEIIEAKNEEIAMAKEAIYLAAMREVALK